MNSHAKYPRSNNDQQNNLKSSIADSSLTDGQIGRSDVVSYHPAYVKNNLKFWYKPKISRDNAIKILKHLPTGSFIIRDSIGFPGAYGLALKVARPPPHVQIKPGEDISNELVRHYLIEPTEQGVRLKGCSNEPTYSKLTN
ncbi:hypothetical protein GJ496_006327 [Pomphorhynchus laevis]|nr:hypothetical protein GJ496_006327 [Pomphorhynchus laevis]